jgi:hypothetical protein
MRRIWWAVHVERVGKCIHIQGFSRKTSRERTAFGNIEIN